MKYKSNHHPEIVSNLVNLFPVTQCAWAKFFGVTTSTFSGWKGDRCLPYHHLKVIQTLVDVATDMTPAEREDFFDEFIDGKRSEYVWEVIKAAKLIEDEYSLYMKLMIRDRRAA